MVDWLDMMRLALKQASEASQFNDVPVGAVIVDAAGEVLGASPNRRERDQNPLAHAEMLALRAAAKKVGNWRLDGCTLVVTLEPCAMCAGAVAQARLRGLVFGAYDPKAGAVASLFDVLRDPRLPHRPRVVGGVLAGECEAVLREFFAARR